MEEPALSARKTHVHNDTQGLIPQQYFVVLERID